MWESNVRKMGGKQSRDLHRPEAQRALKASTRKENFVENDRKLIEVRENSVPLSIFVVLYWKS